ncbi:hypothetical protein KAR91_45655 [Candidatus Pacearchaeota archaeon]|nr:hypothetical protein [Candidatus Pacearchaeota archaeon]
MKRILKIAVTDEFVFKGQHGVILSFGLWDENDNPIKTEIEGEINVLPGDQIHVEIPEEENMTHDSENPLVQSIKTKGMAIINLNELAEKATKLEAGVEQVNIAQMKDAMRAIFDALSPYSDEQIIEAVRRKS